MSRSIQNLCRSRLWPLAAVVALCLGSLLPTWAGSYTYGSSQRTVNAGVLINGSASSNAADSAPYIFYVLNQRLDVKPFGWNIVNPRAPSAINNDIKSRWPAYNVGQQVFPNMAGYWEVPLKDVSADQLLQYDVLYLPSSGGSFAAVDNEKLRRFVDAGGTLIIDYDTTSATPPFSLFADAASYMSGGVTLGLPQDGAPLTLRHPLLTRPYFLSADDILSLGTTRAGGLTASSSSSDFNNLFAPVIINSSSKNAISVSSLGAGQIIASALNIGGEISIYASDPYYGNPGTSPDPAPLFSYAPAQDLRFLSNAISLVDMHPAESKSAHQNGVSNDLPSFAPAWTYLLQTPGTQSIPRSAAVWGGYVFVTDAAGTLHAFDAFPSEDLTGSGKPDDGLSDYSTIGTPYDEIWNVSVGVNASAPTVGSLKGVTSVFVEKADGSVTGFDPITHQATLTIAPSPTSNFGGYTPAPTVYGGRLYAGQSNGSLFVYDPNTGSSANSGILVPTADTSPVAASPTVGLIADGTANDIVSLVTTGANISTVLLGARGDLLSPTPANNPTGYSINRFKFGKQTLFVDKSSTPASEAFSDAGGLAAASGATNTTTPDFTPFNNNGTFYGDWDVDFVNSLSAPGANLNVNQISLSSYGAVTNNIPVSASASPSPMDRNGDFYYRDIAGSYSYIIGVHNSVQFQNVRMKWRFRLPQSTDNITDADGVNYNLLDGFTFVGAPVADNQGYVYAIAYNGSNQASVLCFVANGDVYADLPGGFDASRATFEQPDEFESTLPNQLRPGPTDPNLTYGQFTATGNRATFYNFAVGTLGIRQYAGNLSEPQPITIIPPLDTSGTSTTSQQPATIPLHTNLAWYTTPFSVNGSPSAISKVGNKLYFADATSLFSLPASPSSISGKVATVTPKTEYAHNVGTITAAPSVGQGAMVLNGENGIAAFTQQVTLIADNNRILETDFDGNALWAVDSTNLPIAATATQAASTTKVDFSHPTSISTITANDYLVADTGNNRCVRFDRAGNVPWELTRFNDPNGLLPVGAPLTISQPSSVQMRRYLDTDPSNANGFKESYLVADSGNFRVIEVTDTYNAQAALLPNHNHVLTFVTHTYEQSNRRYRYTSAAYFNTPNGLLVAALVSNIRVALNATGTGLGSASGDAPGGSILLFNASTGAPAAGFTSFLNNGQILPMRNPRFLSVYTPPSAGSQPYSFLYADDNGAFDLSYNGSGFTTTAGNLAFTADNYHQMQIVVKDPNNPPNTITINVPLNNGSIPNRSSLPFVPTCVQRIGTSIVNGVSTPRYLITQNHSQGELGDPGSTSLGGEIFEVDGVATPIGLYSGGTLSRPALTGPLTQPTYAIVQ